MSDTPIVAIVSDFGGVLTTPLLDSFLAFERASGIPLEAHGHAIMAITAQTGANPLFELETGRMSEADFLSKMGAAITEHLGRAVQMAGFGRAFLEHLHPNGAMIDHMQALHERGLRTAICTNNVREWEATWRAKLPMEIFELVVDSAFVGIRKPDSGIYTILLDRLGVPAEQVLFVDDVAENCETARALGMVAVQFHDTDQAIGDIERSLDQFSEPSLSQQ